MNPEIKAKWVEALRSGEYEQGTGSLRIGDHYCCLGVLCEIAVKDRVIERFPTPVGTIEYGRRDVDIRDDVLPRDVAEWADLPYHDFTGGNLLVAVPAELRAFLWADPSGDNERYISALNDRGASFAQIADLIEEQG